MFDDVLSATALIGVSAVLAAAVLTVDTGRGSAPPLSVVSRMSSGATPPAPTTVTAAPATGAMPVYELPRVVVTGHRTRDGEVLADVRTTPPRGPAGAAR